MAVPNDALYLIRLYAPPNRGGDLVLETWHRSTTSYQVELSVSVERAQRGELGRVEVVDCVHHTTTTVWPS